MDSSKHRKKKKKPFAGIKRAFRKVILSPKYLYSSTYNRYYNETIAAQDRDYKQIPILIISFNQLFYLKQLIAFLHRKGYNNIIIVDNNSNYPPLLEYFDEIASRVKVIRLSGNYGHKVVWEKKELLKDYLKGYYAVTDADIVPDENCPDDFMLRFREILDSDSFPNKVGFGLRLDDIPETNPHREKIIRWEEQFWEERTTGGHFIADIDTTFALYRPLNMDFVQKNFYRAIRTDWPYVAKHGGWYVDPRNLTAEQAYYMRTATGSSSWRVDEEGKLIDTQYD